MNFQNSDDLEDALRQDNLSVRQLYTAWEQRLPVPEPAADRGKTGESAHRSPGGEGGAAPQIPWLQGHPALARRFTAHALDQEEFRLVCDAAREALRHWRGARHPDVAEADLTDACVGLRLDLAAALTRLGHTDHARQELEPLVADDGEGDGRSRLRLGRHQRANVLLRLGDTLREEARHLSSQVARQTTAEHALGRYEQALALAPDRLEARLKVAAAALVLGEPGSARRAQAHARAREALAAIAEAENVRDPDFATTAARAVAHAVLGDLDQAAAAYGLLASLGDANTARLAEARHHASYLAEALGQPPDFFRAAFPPLPLVVFTGHLPDRRPDAVPSDRAPRPPRFPPEAVDAVRAELDRQLAAVHARVGLVCAAAGSDLLFIEALRDRGGHAHVVLPWSREEFRRTSVDPFEPAVGEDVAPFWGPRFERALAEAATVREIGQRYRPSSSGGGNYLLEVTAGLALDIARTCRLDVVPMALWDGQPGWVAGGTRSFVELWGNQLQRKVEVFNPLPAALVTLRATTPAAATPSAFAGEAAPRPAPLPPGKATPPGRATTLPQEVKSLLFADIVGYSKLNEDAIPEFVGTFMKRVSELAATSPHAPHSLNTWGDAVYAVFDSPHDAGCFALQLTRMIRDGEQDWLAKGLFWEERGAGPNGSALQHPLNIRVGLHTGPVFPHYDPIVRRLGFTGVHVSRAARIEPVAATGEVFASEEFAALTKLGEEIGRRAGQETATGGPDGQGFTCEYAGTMPLAKGYPGRFRIYRVRSRREFPLEELARTVHERYCHEARARGETPETNLALRPWDELSKDQRQANFDQVADIPHKLRTLGYELAPGHGRSPLSILIPPEKLEPMAIREHDRWMAERQRHGWTYAPERDNARQHHPLIRPWEELSEVEREKDREAVRNLPALIEQARYRVRKIG